MTINQSNFYEHMSHAPLEVKEVCVFASQVSGVIGANRHRKCSDVLETMWERMSPHTFFSALKRNGLTTDQQDLLEVLDRVPEARELVMKSSHTTLTTSQEVASQYTTLSETISEIHNVTDDERRLINECVKRNLYCGYGNAYEDRVLDHIRDHLGLDADRDETFYKKELGSVNGYNVSIGGKIDAINTSRSLIIEIKNRINRLFWRVPRYEFVQVQCYLNLVGVDNGCLVECLQRDTCSVNVIPIEKDAHQWDIIVRHVRAFVDFYTTLLHDEKVQDAYLGSKRRNSFISTYMQRFMLQDLFVNT
jgi:hypothetical protein